MPKLAQKILIIASIIATLGGTLTFLMTWRSIGFSDTFVTSWLSSFALCVLCIAPLGGVISYALNRTINAVLPNFSSLQKNITFGFGMAFIMEAIMGAVTTMNLHGPVGRITAQAIGTIVTHADLCREIFGHIWFRHSVHFCRRCIDELSEHGGFGVEFY